MASPETIGTCSCENCGAMAYVKKNRGGLPYYRCGKCDKHSQEHSQAGARIFLQKVTLFEVDAPPAAPEKAAKSEPPKEPPKKATLAEMLNF